MTATLYRSLPLLLAVTVLAACGGPATAPEPMADDAAAPSEIPAEGFSWRRYAGTEITVLMSEHRVTEGMRSAHVVPFHSHVSDAANPPNSTVRWRAASYAIV